jgi:hypothetical protein
MPVKPSESEEKYFTELELKRRMAVERSRQEAMAATEKKRLRDLHHMCCPKCGQRLAPERYGPVEIDVCAGCKGLWLDANELDQILASREHAGPLRRFLKVLST